MKTGRVFWGVFLLTLGGAFLLERIGIMTLQWHHAWRFWPVVLIAWGVAVLFGGRVVKTVAVVIAALVLALVLAAFLNFSWADDVWEKGAVTQEQTFHEEYTPGITHASFTLESGAGVFEFRDTTADLMTATTTTSFGRYMVERSGSGADAVVRMNLQGGHSGWPHRRMQNRAEVRLNGAPTWDVTLNVGAAKVRCDLSQIKVEHVNVDCGAADVQLRLGSQVPESHVKIDAGASSLNIDVPVGVGCDVRLDAPLSGKHLSDFIRLSKGHFQSENFEAAGHKLYIDIDAGVSSITVDRY
jgi:hypothetical protein